MPMLAVLGLFCAIFVVNRMVFCQGCGTKLIEHGQYCHNCGVGSQNGVAVQGDVNKQSVLSFDDFKKKKETDRRLKFKKPSDKRQTPKSSTKVAAVKVQVGLVSENSNAGQLKKVKGRTIPILLHTNVDADTLLTTAVEKHARHFKQFNKFLDYVVLYSDMSMVHYLPGTSTPFTLERYKSDLLKPYSKLFFWLCAKEEFENANFGSSDSDDASLDSPSYQVGYSSTSAAPGLSSTLSSSQSSATNIRSTSTFTTRCSSSATISSPSITYHQCPTCYGLFSQGEIESHADACADAWVDPIGDPDNLVEIPSDEDEKQCQPTCNKEDATDNSKESSEANLETMRNEVCNLRSACGCELTNRVSIRRRSIFQDYMDARKKKWFKPKSLLKVTFVGEPAIDDGGPKREFFTEMFGHIKRTLFSDNGVPHADMRALANDEFKVTGELMASSLIQGGPAPSFLSMNVYDYIVDGVSSVQSNRWTSLVTDDSLRQSIERIAACNSDEQLRSLLGEESMMDILQMVGYRGVPSKEALKSVTEITRAIVITGIAKTLATIIIDQISTGLATFGALDYIRSHKNVMQPLFTSEGAKHFQPTPELFLDGLNVEYSAEGSNRKTAEIDVYKHFCDFVQDQGMIDGGLVKLYKFITGSDSFTPLGLERVITVQFVHWCVSDCKCRPTASTCDPSINLPVHYKDISSFEEAMTSALKEGFGFGLI